MRDRLGPSTALDTWRFADSLGLTKLATCAARASCKFFSSLTTRAEWLSMPSALVHELLCDDRLRARSEEEVYHAAIAWLHAREPALDDEAAAALLAHADRFKIRGTRYAHFAPLTLSPSVGRFQVFPQQCFPIKVQLLHLSNLKLFCTFHRFLLHNFQDVSQFL